AKIGNAQVDTLQIAGQAVTIPVGTSRTSGAASNGNWVNWLSVYLNAEGGRVFANFAATNATGGGGRPYFRWVVDGGVWFEIPTGSGELNHACTLDVGNRHGVTVAIQCRGASTVNSTQSTLTAEGKKR
ncbi:hypothetical protein TW86_22985, partial [Halomonas sp. S2151]|uniref:hypothetical protein n=1 Tax=Halomonas sp. S2151 TaxID=579478 RepID=UPI0005FA69AD